MEGCKGIGENWAARLKKGMVELNMLAGLENVANGQVDLVGWKGGRSRCHCFGEGGMSTAISK